MTKMPAHNWRFGATAAVTPRKRQYEFETLYPAGSSAGAATTPNRWDVGGKAGDSAVQTERYRRLNMKRKNRIVI